MLRQYKPEKHPEEFQRIRAAFEELERRLRYGHADNAAPSVWEGPRESATEHQPTSEAETVIDPPARVAGQSTEQEPTDLESLATRLESGRLTVEQLVERLAKLSDKTPPDYYALALASDATGPAEELLLLRWLLKGLAKWPGDPALSRLVYAYLGSQTPVERLPQVLVACSRAVPGDAFFELTEGGWDRLLRGESFGVFSKTLAECEKQVEASRDPSISGRVAFYIHALRYALWKDPTDWKTRAWEFVEENYDQVPEHLEHDFDSLGIVREYLAHREEFVQEHPLRRKMDRVLSMAFAADQLEADRAVEAIQAELRESPVEAAEAFPPEASEAGSAFYTLWAWMSEDTASRVAPPIDSEPDYRLWQGRVIELLHQMQHRGSIDKTIWDLLAVAKSIAGPIGILFGGLVAFIATFVTALTVVEFSAGSLPDDAFGLCTIMSGLAMIVGLAVSWRFWPKFLDNRIWLPFCRRMAKRCYRRVWRPEAFAFMDRSLLDYFAFRDLVAGVAEQTADERTWISHFVTQDFGLAVYAIAQRFRA